MSGGTTASSALRARRRAAGLSQEELAERARCSVRTVRYLESGTAKRPHGDTLRAVAAALQLTGSDSAEFVASWREVAPDRFLATRAREEAITQSFIELRGRVRDIAVQHTVVLDETGQQHHTITRRSFEALTPGVDTFPWMAGLEGDQGDPGLITVTECVNMRLESATPLPVTGAIAFVGHLGGELAVGEARTVGYRMDWQAARRTRSDGAHDREAYFASGGNLDFVSLEVHFHPDRIPARVLTVRRPKVHDAESSEAVEFETPLSPFGIAQYLIRPAVGDVYGLRWEWPGDTS